MFFKLVFLVLCLVVVFRFSRKVPDLYECLVKLSFNMLVLVHIIPMEDSLCFFYLKLWFFMFVHV